MKIQIKKLNASLAALLLALPAFAAGATPVGRWQTIDDATGKPKSIVEITDTGGELQGKVIKLLNPSKPNPTCDKCEGELQGKPIEGMTILWGIKKDGEVWDGGKIIDPESGKVYSAKLTPEAGGDKLQVRGYLGISMLGRTQEWIKAP
ncbi:MAG: hypothetical protein JWQ90_4221 [Hydrocarboniphaga sp.]|uniref:DUF2147 domain-containing protein n=1 Tax=Hydrocarboniphaga sp. TaxID=2033016 RepID=UPI0026160341|nr:DUF2147 domain-containing protein [Hydrocarboniphaga sp.]MDB5971771.1 hypothetical protein [Hydrocarboniphaga sp.]